MLANQLISNNFPSVDPEDTVFLALQLMEDYEIQHLAVVNNVNNKYIGLLSKDNLLDADDGAAVQSLAANMFVRVINENEHFVAALKFASQNTLSIVPVTNNENEYIGVIPAAELLKASARFIGVEEQGAVIVLEMERKSYSFGEISRLVETNDAFITQFNSFFEPESGLLIVTLKINKLEVSDIISTFQRYEYSVRYYIGEEQYENELKYNYDHLMSYLKF